MRSMEEKMIFLREKILAWGRENTRGFPWRKERHPYNVLVSEMMLHRTRSSQVVRHYIRFIEKYPDFRSICDADLNEIMADLKSLGLYWRARMLHELSCVVCEKFDCKLPMDKKVLTSLPGIGDYISSAVLCFVCDRSEPVLDTNTVRIISRYFGMDMNDSSRRSIAYHSIMSSIIAGVSCREISYAMLDFGSEVCTKRSPSCEICPLRKMCDFHAKWYERRISGDGGV